MGKREKNTCFDFKIKIDYAKHNALKKFVCQPIRILSLREIIDNVKNNQYSPPLSEITVTFPDTGISYTMAELDEILNN